MPGIITTSKTTVLKWARYFSIVCTGVTQLFIIINMVITIQKVSSLNFRQDYTIKITKLIHSYYFVSFLISSAVGVFAIFNEMPIVTFFYGAFGVFNWLCRLVIIASAKRTKINGEKTIFISGDYYVFEMVTEVLGLLTYLGASVAAIVIFVYLREKPIKRMSHRLTNIADFSALSY